TSRLWVRRVRTKSFSARGKTCVLSCRRRKAEEKVIRSASMMYGERRGSRAAGASIPRRCAERSWGQFIDMEAQGAKAPAEAQAPSHSSLAVGDSVQRWARRNGELLPRRQIRAVEKFPA